MSGAQAHLREVNSLEKQISTQERCGLAHGTGLAGPFWVRTLTVAAMHGAGRRMARRRLAEVRTSYDRLAEEVSRYQAAVAKAIKYNNRVRLEIDKLKELETEEVPARTTVAVGEGLGLTQRSAVGRAGEGGGGPGGRARASIRTSRFCVFSARC